MLTTVQPHSLGTVATAGRAPVRGPIDGEQERRRVGTLAIIAHDLKAPLANLDLLLGAMAIENAKAGPDRRTGLTQRAERLVARLSQLLDALIERERAYGDPLAIVAREHDLGAILRTVASCNEAAAERRFVRLQVRVSGALPIRGDGELLMQAIDNLIANAVRHTEPGGRVLCEADARDTGEVVVRIRDGGAGLGAADIAQLFRPFIRVGALADDGAGHGLGLWIVRLVAENHGGRVSAERTPGARGTTFALSLPRARTVAAA
jgi:two-component system heavy metal sensor histidine kinase CusS